jgi:hypothetical protein
MKPMQNIEDQVIAGNSNYHSHFGIARSVSSLIRIRGSEN